MKKSLERIEKYVENGVFPGCEFVVIDGNLTAKFQFGKRTILPEITALGTHEIWDLASVSKVVGTGTVLINLIFDGKIELDKPLNFYDAAFHDKNVTIRQLLTHTSGINPFIKNRDEMNAEQLKQAIYDISVTADKSFKYTDINFILLGFLLEKCYKKSLDEIFDEQIFKPWKMSETSFGPRNEAVPTDFRLPIGQVHDPKARVLGIHTGSAGLFSSLSDLTKFVQAYFADDKYLQLLTNFSGNEKQRSLAWDLLKNDWILHTGYTGTFILINLKTKKAVIFLSNRVHLKDGRAQWILDRNLLIADFIEELI